MGLQDLVMFRDNLQQPEMTGMDNLRNLQALTMQGMASENYMNQPQPMMMDTGLMSLPVAQAGFGGFIKKITSIPRAIVRTVKRVAKSPLGKLAITAAPMVFGLPPVFSNPALNAAFFSGATTLATGGDPEDALKSAVLSGGLAGVAGVIEVSANIGQLQPEISFGYGFTAIIVAFLGRLNPVGILFAGIMLATVKLGADNAQISMGIPKVVTGLFEGILLFFLLVGETLQKYRIKWSKGKI